MVAVWRHAETCFRHVTSEFRAGARTRPKSPVHRLIAHALRERWLHHVAVWFVVLGGVAGLGETQLGRDLEAKTLDLRFRFLNRDLSPGDDVVLIAIDNQSLKTYSGHGQSWPWPRDFYARLTEYLSAAPARAILFDMLFYEPDVDRGDVDGAVSDAYFAAALRESGRVILATEASRDGMLGVEEGIRPLLSTNPDALRDLSPYPGLIAPVRELRLAAQSLGVTNVEHDPDGTLRRVPLIYRYGSGVLPQFAVAAWLVGHPESSAIAVQGNQFLLDGQMVPWDSQRRYLVNWYPANPPGQAFTQVPFAAVMQSAAAEEIGGEATLDRSVFAGKFVIVGATASGLLDIKRSPLGEMPGMLVWATVMSNLEGGHYLQELPCGANALVTAFAVFLGGVLALRSQSIAGSSVALLVPASIGAASAYLWSSHGIVLAVVAPLAGGLGAYVGSTTLAYMAESRSKAAIRQAFSKYLHPDLVADLVESQDTEILAPREVETTVLFSDIGDFTGYCEGRHPSEIVTRLNEYFDVLAGVVLDHQGMLDKYTGDGIMALFGVPVSREDHAELACQVALAHRELSALGVSASGQALPSLEFHRRTRIGVNSGPIVVGNIGARRRTDYTAVGDNVNLAARLEGLNKLYHTKVIVSETTRDLVKDRFLCRRLDCVRVVGRHAGTYVYELVAELEGASQDDLARVALYERALAAYQEGRWSEARQQFGELAADDDGDYPSEMMVERCEQLEQRPPTEWDGIYGAEVK